jgi:hypothetical protein
MSSASISPLRNLVKYPEKERHEDFLKFEVHSAVNMSMLVSWIVVSCGLVLGYQRFAEPQI